MKDINPDRPESPDPPQANEQAAHSRELRIWKSRFGRTRAAAIAELGSLPERVIELARRVGQRGLGTALEQAVCEAQARIAEASKRQVGDDDDR